MRQHVAGNLVRRVRQTLLVVTLWSAMTACSGVAER